MPHHGKGWSVAASLTACFSSFFSVAADAFSLSPSGERAGVRGLPGNRNIGSFDKNFAMITAPVAAQAVAMIAVPTIAAGLLALFAEKIAMAVTGMS